MTEECTQYLAQLQKDWERQRVKMGVEALKKEVRDPVIHARFLDIDVYRWANAKVLNPHVVRL